MNSDTFPWTNAGPTCSSRLSVLATSRGAIVLTTNTAYKQWPRIFNNDSTITTAVLDRLLHHCETIKIQGKSYRMKDKV